MGTWEETGFLMFHVGKANPKSYVLLFMFNCCFLERSLTVHLSLRCKHFGLQGRVKTFLPKYIYICSNTPSVERVLYAPNNWIWGCFQLLLCLSIWLLGEISKKGECYTRYCVRLRIVFITNLYGFQWIGVLNCFSKP